jgi:hypothetical protein
MGARSIFSVVTGIVVAGCLSAQPGLANVAGIPAGGPGGTPEMRVHDVIANGRDSCPRSGEGSVLRGQIPPCGAEQAHDRASYAPPAPDYSLDVCPAPAATPSRADNGLVAFPLSSGSRLWLACEPPGSPRP